MGRTSTSRRVTERLEERLEPARDLLTEAGERARDTAEVARDRAADLAEAVEPRARELGAAVGGGARTALGALALLPALVTQLLTFLAGVTGALAERGREVADRIEPPAAAKRRSKLRLALWFLGGFGAGTAAGWVLHARMQEPPASAEPAAGTQEGPAGETASPIDARRERAGLA